MPQADFDGDGNRDFVALAQYDAVVYGNVSAGTAAWVYYGNGKGNFAAPVLAGLFDRNYTNIAAGDLNKDGRTDIVLSLSDSSYSSYAVGVIDSETGRTFGPEVSTTRREPALKPGDH